MFKKYSIVIPHYNDSERLERLLRSTPGARADVEIIVVDDRSPNQSALDAMRACWPAVRWLSTEQNGGAGVARNVGLDAARGRWLVFADSDDEFIETAFETFDKVLQSDDELVYFLAEAVQEADGQKSVRSERMNALVIDYAQSPSAESFQNLRLQHVNPVAKIYSRSFVETYQLRFDPVRRSNDIAFNVLAAVQARRVRAETIPVYRIYRRLGSLTANISATAFMERFLVDRSLAQRLAAMGVRKARSATGHMLLSARYGLKVMLRVWWLSMYSPMFIEWSRIFDLRRWQRFFSNQRREVLERER